MTTFSQLIDKILPLARQGQMQIAEAVQHLNSTIFEIHYWSNQQNNGSPIFFRPSMIEDILIADRNPFIWNIPNPRLFLGLHAVQYPVFPDQPYARQIVLGEHANDLKYKYYRSGDVFIFQNFGPRGSAINIAYFVRAPQFSYIPTSERLVTFNESLGQYEYSPTLNTPELREQALTQYTHWLIERYESILINGFLAKLYGRNSNDNAARSYYSQYLEGRLQIANTEGVNVRAE